MALIVGCIPDEPTRLFNIISTSDRDDNSSNPSLPWRTEIPESFNDSFTKSTLLESTMAIVSGWYFLACSIRTFEFLYALKAFTLNLSAKLSITFKAFTPIEPVDPSIEIFFIIRKNLLY